MLIIDDVTVSSSSTVILPGEQLVFDATVNTEKTDPVTGDFFVFSGDDAVASVIELEPDLLIIDGDRKLSARLDTGQTDFVVITSGGPQGIQGIPGPSGPEPLLEIHIQAESPHPKYDDMPSFTLLFENGLI